MPFVFAGSAVSAAGGLAMLAAPVAEAGPARRAAVLGAALELAASRRLERRPGAATGPYREGRSGALLRAGEALTATGVLGSLAAGLLGSRPGDRPGGRPGRGRATSALSGAAFLAASALTRFGVFEAGLASAADPAYTVAPQRARLNSAAAPHR
jgi:hypothetical protein